MSEKKDFFISYTKTDRRWAEWVAWQLKAEGFSTVIQVWDIRPGANFVHEMDKATTQAERVVAILSSAYLDSLFGRSEWYAFFARDPTGEERRVIPVRVQACEVEGLLGQIVYIDLVGLNGAAAKETLLEGVREAYEATPPDFPGDTAPEEEEPQFPPDHPFPAIWSVPHRQNPNFTGRKDVLEQLRAALTSGEPTAVTQAIAGLGGIGKTTLAVEYAYRHAATYDLVWWVRAEESVTLRTDLAELAYRLGLIDRQVAEQEKAVQAALAWFPHHTNWLLVLDNALHPAAVRDYLPQGGSGHVLITSRHATWRGTATPLRLNILARDESIAFLLRRTGRTDDTGADALADALGDLPLALEHAGAYIDIHERSFSDYLALFQTHQPQLLAWLPQDAPADTVAVATTWNLSLQQAAEAAPAAADLLNLCAFLAPDDIPRWLLTKHADKLPEPLKTVVQDDFEFDNILVALRRYSLIEAGEDVLVVHRMVQAVVCNSLPEEDQNQWAATALRLVSIAFPFDSDDVRTWDICTPLLPHALAVLERAEGLEEVARKSARLLNDISVFVWARGEYSEARKYLEQSLRITTMVYGANSPDVAVVLCNLGSVLGDLGKPEQAKVHYERALEIHTAAYGASHPTVAIDLSNLGLVLLKLDLKQARKHLERSMEILKLFFEANHPNIAKE